MAYQFLYCYFIDAIVFLISWYCNNVSMHNYMNDPYMSLVTTKPVFGVRLKPVCSATEASQSPEISNIETRDILFRQQTPKVLIRLRECAGWSAPLLFA